jgi:O-antigen chain-terminating methyltransferase
MAKTIELSDIYKEIHAEADKFRSQPLTFTPSTNTNVQIIMPAEGNSAKFDLKKVRGIGYLIKWFLIFVRLPVRIQQLYDNFQYLNLRINQFHHRTNHRLEYLQAKLKSTADELHGLQAHYHDFQLSQSSRARSFADAQDALKFGVAELQQDFEKGHVGTAPAQQGESSPASTRIRSLYAQFENHFRGHPDDIRAKQRLYIEHLRKSPVDFKKFAVVDIGCGRGEWIEELATEGIRAFGVDSNISMCKEAEARGQKVIIGNGIDYLRELPDASLGGVTAFHVVEHLSINDMIDFLYEAHRVLVPDGILIIETPNPENLNVGSCNFYVDPTHVRPIPPVTLSFFLSSVGLPSHETKRLNSMVDMIEPTNNTQLDEILRRFYLNQDYAIIARKERTL